MEIQQIQKAITEKTKTIMLNHLYRLVCRDNEAIISLVREFNLKEIVDFAHATGAEYQEKNGETGRCGFLNLKALTKKTE